MRWHTSKYETAAEAAERKDLVRKIDAWWDAFRATAPKIGAYFSVRDAHKEFDVAEWMHEHLSPIHEALMWEYGQALHQAGHRLVITPEYDRYLRPLTDEILRRAPTVSGFEFYGARLAEPLDDAIEMATHRTNSDLLLTGIDCKPGDGHRVDLTVSVRKTASEKEQDIAWSQASIIVNTLVGEELTDCWLGYIDISPSGTSLSHLNKLKSGFYETVRQCQSKRPSHPFFQSDPNGTWTMYEMKPDPEKEITRRSDLFVYRTMIPEFFRTTHNGIPFYSQRFSARCERFIYLMLDGREADMEAFEDKASIEDALEAALVPRGLGAMVGTGTGRRYSYIDLAVTDVFKACSTVVDVLRQGGIVKNSWILFHDDEWRDEWIGIYDDTPPPLTA
jgi:hypothetical protein